MKKTLFSLALLLAATTAGAENRSLEEMQSIAAAKLRQTAAVKSLTGKTVSQAALQRVMDDAAYSVFTSQQSTGFVIVAKSTLAAPIIGYSSEPFDTDNLPAGLRWYLGQVSRNLQDLEAGRRQAPRRAATFTPVENFITTKWSQEYPFDRKTPNNYPCGCVATALAQCMNYCQWPASAEFEGTYFITTSNGKKTTTDRKEVTVSTTYNWPYKDTYKAFGKYGDNIDELMRDCGYATYMEYEKDGSGTHGFRAGIALTHKFSYPSESVKQQYFSYFDGDQEDWNQIIYDELGRRCPILYGANDESFGGHAFVFSGVDEEGLVYINWGWRGTADGYYDIWAMNPQQDNMQLNFSGSHHMVYGIRKEALPTDHVESRISAYDSAPYTFRWTTEKDDDGVEHHTLFCDQPYGLINISSTDFEGVFGLFGQDLTDGTSWVIAEDLQDRDTIPAGYAYGGSSEQYKDFAYYYYIDGEHGLKPGHTYHLSFGTKNDLEGTWHSIIADGGEVGYEVYYSGDPATSTIKEDNLGAPVMTAIHAPAAATATDGLTRVYDTAGRLVYSAPAQQFNLWDVPARGILVIKQGGQSRKVVR
ncbi:MAG: C10 family peptidase [Bacteroidaceae bacterium]|nr:C10 family peptidase [Bacteroidaceae bacterium]